MGQATPAAPRALRKLWQTSTRRGADELKNRYSPPLRDPLHGRAQASPRAEWLQSGNSSAVLSDLSEQDDSNSEAVKETVKAEDDQEGKTVARNSGYTGTAITGRPGCSIASLTEISCQRTWRGLAIGGQGRGLANGGQGRGIDAAAGTKRVEGPPLHATRGASWGRSRSMCLADSGPHSGRETSDP